MYLYCFWILRKCWITVPQYCVTSVLYLDPFRCRYVLLPPKAESLPFTIFLQDRISKFPTIYYYYYYYCYEKLPVPFWHHTSVTSRSSCYFLQAFSLRSKKRLSARCMKPKTLVFRDIRHTYQDRQCTYNLTLKRVRAAIITVGKQYILRILSVCL